MKLGVFTPVFGALPVDEMLAKVRSLRHVKAIELGTGAWPGRAHLDDLDEMINGHCRATTFRDKVFDAGLTISALSCHGNPLHPDKVQAAADDQVFRQTVLLAEKMQVPVVVTFSGCPGDCEGASHPNWVTTAWPPEFLSWSPPVPATAATTQRCWRRAAPASPWRPRPSPPPTSPGF